MTQLCGQDSIILFTFSMRAVAAMLGGSQFNSTFPRTTLENGNHVNLLRVLELYSVPSSQQQETVNGGDFMCCSDALNLCHTSEQETLLFSQNGEAKFYLLLQMGSYGVRTMHRRFLPHKTHRNWAVLVQLYCCAFMQIPLISEDVVQETFPGDSRRCHNPPAFGPQKQNSASILFLCCDILTIL